MGSLSRSEYASYEDDPLQPKPGQKNVVQPYAPVTRNPNTYKLLYSVQDSGAQILQGKAGDLVIITPEDKNTDGPWVWATMQSTGESGYVPLGYITDAN